MAASIFVGSGWEEDHKGFAASRIAVGPDGQGWAVDKFQHIVWRFDGTWQEAPGVLARDIAVANDGTVWVIAKDGNDLHAYRNGTWAANFTYSDGEARSITLDLNGNPWFTNNNDDGRLYSW